MARYADSFGYQWHRFARTQLDSRSYQISEERIRTCTGWTPEELQGETVLEVGCGAGRFTDVFVKWGARVVAVDLSAAVYVAAANVGHGRGAVFARADALALPTAPARFRYVFCYGVLQHTPDPAATFRALAGQLAPAGKLSADVYLKDGKIEPHKAKYLWRWLTTRLPAPVLYAVVWTYVPIWLPVDTLLRRIPGVGKLLASVVPCFNWWTSLRRPSWEALERTVLDTFDALSAKYDLPQTKDDVERWRDASSFERFSVTEGANGLVINAVAAR